MPHLWELLKYKIMSETIKLVPILTDIGIDRIHYILYTKVKPGLKAFCPRCTKLNEPGTLCNCGCREAIVVDEESWNEETH